MNPQSTDRLIRQTELDMLTLAGGRIILHDEKTRRQWTLTLKPFSMARHAVTEELYALFSAVQASPDSARPVTQGPVTQVSWHDAVHFCNNLSQAAGLQACYTFHKEGGVAIDWAAGGYRLPSEAEWEHACRAGTAGVRYGDLDAIAWYRENSGQTVQPVGLKAPNAWGLYDMIGNVWEWCWDLFDPEIYGPYRVFRGGGWFDSPTSCRASCRRKSHPTLQTDDLGFRLARSVPGLLR